MEAFKKAGRSGDTPAAVVYRASWPDERRLMGTLNDIAQKCRDAGLKLQSMIIIGEAIGPACLGYAHGEKSKLYDPGFTHGSRVGKE